MDDAIRYVSGYAGMQNTFEWNLTFGGPSTLGASKGKGIVCKYL